MHTFSVVAVRARRESPSPSSTTKVTRSKTERIFCGSGRSASDCERTPMNHGAIRTTPSIFGLRNS